jgi:uncharacterized membrane protein
VNAHAIRVMLPLCAVLAVAGIGIATYLTAVHYAGEPIVCSSIGDCELVNSSKYSKLAGVPVALLGGLAYVALLALVAGAWVRREGLMLAGAWAVALGGFAFSMYLTYVELWVLDAICIYCVASASILTALLVLLSGCVWLARDEIFGEVEELEEELGLHHHAQGAAAEAEDV